MSGSGFRSQNSGPPENWQPGQDYWIYLPTNLSDVPPPRRSQLNPRGRTRDPWSLYEERSTRGPNNGSSSFPSGAPPRPSVRLLLIDDIGRRPAILDIPPPTYYEPPSPPLYQYIQTSAEDQESSLSPEEQNKALNKLRKQLYSPHMSSIIKRLGTKSSSSDDHIDDIGKRCAVCLEDFESNKFVTVTPCNHMFHEECIVPWVKSQGKCPICRFDIAGKNSNAAPQRSNSYSGRGGGIERDLISAMRSFNL